MQQLTASSLALTAIVVFTASIGLANSIAQFVVGVTFSNECPSNPMLPLLLLASGLCAILMLTVCLAGGMAVRFCGQNICIKAASISVFVFLLAAHFCLNGALCYFYSRLAATPEPIECYPQLMRTVKVAFPIALVCGGALFSVPIIACLRCTSDSAPHKDEAKVRISDCGESGSSTHDVSSRTDAGSSTSSSLLADV